MFGANADEIRRPSKYGLRLNVTYPLYFGDIICNITINGAQLMYSEGVTIGFVGDPPTRT